MFKISGTKTLYLDVEGRRIIQKYLFGFRLKGYAEDIKVRRFDPKKGIVTYGVKLRGLSAGNIDLEIPLHLKDGKLSEPVIGFVDGNAVLLGEGLFTSLLDSVNLKTKHYTNWMDLNRQFGVGELFIINKPNKFASQKVELEEAISDFFVNTSSSILSVSKSLNKKGRILLASGLSTEDALSNLYSSFGSRIPFSLLRKFAEDDYEFYGESPPGVTPDTGEEGYEEYETQGEYPAELETLMQEEQVVHEEVPEAVSEETVEYEEPEPKYEPLIEVPEVYREIIFPSVEELIEIIKYYRVIKFVYKKLNDEWTIRTVEPHYLWLTKKGNIVMISWDYLRGDWRAFDIGRVREVEVLNHGEWIELGQFVSMLEDAQGKGVENLDMNDAYIPRGPYHDTVTRVRGELKRMNRKFGGIIHDHIESIIEKLNAY